jgi:glycine oxidase
VRNWDVIIVGGGIIGLSLAIELRRNGATVLVVDRGEIGREASYAAGGMIADGIETPPALRDLATASARMYPEFVRELESKCSVHVDLRDYGTILFSPDEDLNAYTKAGVSALSLTSLTELEPALTTFGRPAFLLNERSVDPRALTSVVLQTAKHRGVDISSGDPVTSVNLSDGHVVGVSTNKTSFLAEKVVNCAGAWSGQIGPYAFPTHPVKGQMLCLISPKRELLKHVIRAPEIYLIPRSDGRILVGATIEEAGFDKRTDVATVQRLHRDAIALVPALKEAKILEDWAGLRPGTPDSLPILGATPTPGYYVATGHFRDGILLAPITARVMAQVIAGKKPDYSLDAFSPSRFQ